jgi:hypothetical protein
VTSKSFAYVRPLQQIFHVGKMARQNNVKGSGDQIQPPGVSHNEAKGDGSNPRYPVKRYFARLVSGSRSLRLAGGEKPAWIEEM